MRIAIDVRRVSEFGVGSHVWNLVRNLARIDAENAYFLIGSERQRREFGTLGGNFHSIEVSEDEGFIGYQLRMPLRLRRNRIDVLHVPHYQAPLVVPCRLVVTIHDCVHLLFPQEGSSKFENYRGYLFTKRVLRRASHIIAVSGSTREDLVSIFDLPEDKISVVHNALDGRFTERHDPEEQKQVLERYQLADPFILYVGQIKPHKNLDRLIEAFAVLRNELSQSQTYQTLKLIIIGDAISQHPYLRLTVVRSGVQQHVRFLGFVPGRTLQVFYEAAAMFASPSLYEGFGLPPLEAMANGTPVVASNTASVPEVLDDAAVLVNPENVFEIARAMKTVLTDQTLRQGTIEKGLRQVKKFSWETAAEQVLHTYRQVAGKVEADAVAEVR